MRTSAVDGARDRFSRWETRQRRRWRRRINPWIVLNSLSIRSIRSRRKIEVSLLWLRAARTCARSREGEGALCACVWPFLPGSLISRFSLWREKGTKGKNDEQTPAGAYPVRWPIQRCKICIYDPQWTPKITKYKRRFSWFWIILHSPPWPPLTPPGTASTFQWDRKGPLARRGFMVQPFLFRPRKFHGPVREDKGFRVVLWWTSELSRIKNLSAKDGSPDRKEAAKYRTACFNRADFKFYFEK